MKSTFLVSREICIFKTSYCNSTLYDIVKFLKNYPTAFYDRSLMNFNNFLQQFYHSILELQNKVDTYCVYSDSLSNYLLIN